MGGGGKGGGSQQVTNVNTDPWRGRQPYLQYLYNQAGNLPAQQAYPGSGVVPFSPATGRAMQAQTQRALAGSPVQAAGQQQALNTLGGAYLGFDPVQQATQAAAYGADAAQRRIAPQIRSQFEAAGRYGSGLSRTAETQALADAFADRTGQFANMYSQQYQGERDRMLRAMGAAPALAQSDYYDIAQLAQVGGQQEARAQSALDDAMQRWYFQQQAPYLRLSAQQQAISPQSGGQQTQSSVPLHKPTAIQGAIAGGTTGAAFGPWGAAIGAGLGLLASDYNR